MSDTIELGTVTQLNPHVESDQIVATKTSKEGDELVSLDDIYEITGQESLPALVRSCKQYFENNKLSKESMTCLQLSGFESFIPGYDRYNTRIGGESFLATLKDGFIKIIQGIIRFLTELSKWAAVRLKALFAFGHSARDVAAISHEYTEQVLPRIRNILITTIKNYDVSLLIDPNNIIEALPENISGKQAISLFKISADDNAKTIANMTAALPEAFAIEKQIEASISGTRVVRQRYNQLVRGLKEKLKRGEITETDIAEFSQGINTTIVTQLDPSAIMDRVIKLIETTYDLELKGFAQDKAYADFQAFAKDKITSAKVAVTQDTFEQAKECRTQFLEQMKNANEIKLDVDQIKELSSALSTKDADVLKIISDKYPQHASILGSYIEFGNHITRYNQALDIAARYIGMIKSNATNVVKWMTAMDALAAAYLIGDLEKIEEALKGKTGTEVLERDELVDINGSLRLFRNDLQILNSAYPNSKNLNAAITICRESLKLAGMDRKLNKILAGLHIPVKV